MNHVVHHIEAPPGLTPPRLLAGGREGKVLYVESQYYVIYEPRVSNLGMVGWYDRLTNPPPGSRRGGVSIS